MADQVYVDRTGLPPSVVAQLVRIAAFQNPEFYRAQAMRLATPDRHGSWLVAGDFENALTALAEGADRQRSLARVKGAISDPHRPAVVTRGGAIETLPGGRRHRIVETDGDEGPLDEMAERAVPPGRLFVLGDNRDNAMDSRVAPEAGGYGAVPIERVIGRVMFDETLRAP